MGYSIAFLWIILPVSTFISSLFIGKNDYFGNLKWISPIVFGIMHMLAEYATFSMSNMLSNPGKINMPEIDLFLFGAVISIIGLVIGTIIKKIKKHI